MFCFSPLELGHHRDTSRINYAESTCVVNLLTAITELISIFLFTTLFIFVARKVAKKIGLVDKPNYRKRHQGLIPLVGAF